MSTTTNLEAGRLYLRIRLRREMHERPDLLPAITEVLGLVESALQPQPPAYVPRLARPFAETTDEPMPTQFAGRSVRGDTLMATILGAP